MSAQLMAIGDSGRPEPATRDDTHAPRTLPVGPRNAVTPASIRFIYWGRPGSECRAVRVKRIHRPHTRCNLGPFVKVVFECTPFTRATLPEGPLMANEKHVALTRPADAADPLWATLPVRDQQRLHEAMAAMQ